MSEILFLAHRIPFPPDRGDKIRSHHVLRHLAKIAPVHVATFAEDAFDRMEEGRLAELAASYELVRRSKPLSLAGVQALASGKPVSLTAFHSQTLEAYVTHVLATRPISAIYVFSGQMGQYVPADFEGRVVVDFVDVDSAKFEVYAVEKGGPRGWIDSREGRVLCREEARLARRADTSLLISRNECELFASRLLQDARCVTSLRAMANGIDSTVFDPDEIFAEQRMLAVDGPKAIFTGQMDYAPNIAAVKRAIELVMPLVREEIPEATFHVVGRNPPNSVRAQHRVDGTFVWGRVPDIRQWIKAADIALVPLEIARGVQNKVLEAMSMGLPVVLSPGAATGIDANDGEHFCIGESNSALADAVVDLLKAPDCARAMGEAARDFIVEQAGWEAALAPLAGYLGFPEGALRNAA